MQPPTQTILGSGGPVGTELARALRHYTQNIRLVSRNPEKVHPEDETCSANLLDSSSVREAVKGSKVVYLTAGLEYKYEVWEKQWPKIMQNVIAACKESDARLVFFDNVYMYDEKSTPHMTEQTPVKPPSRKGAVRARIAEMLMQEVWTGQLEALIARSADFYGPGIENNSILIETVFKPLSEGKKANWLGAADKKHSFTYVPDAAAATALLGNSEEVWNEIWHLPTAARPLTGHEWVQEIAEELGVKPAYRVVSKWMVRLMGFFMPVMKETVEMMYQYEQDYVFDSSKFGKHFDFKPTTYSKGIKQVVHSSFRKN